jgi:hypothetical protein
VITKYKKEMENLARKFFMDLYKADTEVIPQSMLHLYESTVSQDMNDNLCKEFTDQEIGDALFQMGPLKAPGRMVFLVDSFKRIGSS